MESQSFGARVKRTTTKVFKILLLAGVVVGLIVFAFFYWATYEDGVMAGKILRISEKGVLFKTYEGKINLETFGAMRDTSPIAESFDFSVEKSEHELIQQLQQVALSGERVNLYFVKRYARFSWRGDTKYFATRIERLGNNTPATDSRR
jgi:hypothetical protein